MRLFSFGKLTNPFMSWFLIGHLQFQFLSRQKDLSSWVKLFRGESWLTDTALVDIIREIYFRIFSAEVLRYNQNNVSTPNFQHVYLKINSLHFQNVLTSIKKITVHRWLDWIYKSFEILLIQIETILWNETRPYKF